MKRLTLIALALCMLLGSAVSASATEIKASGYFQFDFVWSDNTNFMRSEDDNQHEDDFYAQQIFRAQIDFIASENLKGVFYIESGDTIWGDSAKGGDIGTDGISIEVRRAYIDFTVPSTDLQLRVGLQGLSLPSAVVGNPVLDGVDVAAILASYPINDMISVAAVWARLYDNDGTELMGQTENPISHDEVDAFGLLVPVTLDGFSFTPWFLFANVGDGSNANLEALTAIDTNTGSMYVADWVQGYWLGLAAEVTALDPFIMKLDVVWGTTDTGNGDMDASGWYIAGAIAYKMDFMTPTLAAWWASGEDGSETNGSEQLPYVDGDFYPTTWGFDGGSTRNALALYGDQPQGTWGIGLQLNDISFIEDLTHQFIVAYVGGTNSEDSPMTFGTADYAWEIDFNTKYMIYENLAAVLELGWTRPYYDEDDLNDNIQDAWKAAFVLKYSF